MKVTVYVRIITKLRFTHSVNATVIVSPQINPSHPPVPGGVRGKMFSEAKFIMCDKRNMPEQLENNSVCLILKKNVKHFKPCIWLNEIKWAEKKNIIFIITKP